MQSVFIVRLALKETDSVQLSHNQTTGSVNSSNRNRHTAHIMCKAQPDFVTEQMKRNTRGGGGGGRDEKKKKKHTHKKAKKKNAPKKNHIVLHTSVLLHLCTSSCIQVCCHTCAHCPTYKCVPTPVHTVLQTSVSPHLYILSYRQVCPHTCTYCPTDKRGPTSVHTVLQTSAVLPNTGSCIPTSGHRQLSDSDRLYVTAEDSLCSEAEKSDSRSKKWVLT